MKTKISRKAIILIVAAALLIALAVGGTVAYLEAQAPAVTNTFVPGYVDCLEHRVLDNESSPTKITSITVENTGNVPAYIRVAITVNSLNEAGQLTGNIDPDTYFCGNDWEKKSDGFYYFKNSVAAGALTTELLKSGVSEIPLNDQVVTVLAEAIQAEGMGASSAYNAFQIAKGGS